MLVDFVFDETVRIRVRDEGCGISLESRTHLFEPFRSRKSGGTGLGLFLSRQSKGYSGFVAAFREVLRETLEPDTWHVGGGEGSLIAIYLPAVEVLREVTGEERGNLYRLLGAFRGFSEAASVFAGSAAGIAWDRLREERFS